MTRILVITVGVVVVVAGIVFVLSQQPDTPATLEEFGQGSSTVTTVPLTKREKRQRLNENPSEDGWDTEAFHEAASAQLELLGKLIGRPDMAKLASLVDDDKLIFAPLRPHPLETTIQSSSLVARSQRDATEEVTVPKRSVGDFLLEIEDLRGPFSIDRCEFKTFRIKLGAQSVKTRVYYQLFGHTEDGSMQQNATWTCVWTRPLGEAPPRLIAIHVQDFEETVVRYPHQTLFTDRTPTLLADETTNRQLNHGAEYWMDRLECGFGIERFFYQGLSVGDSNGDGLDDLYLPQTGGLPNVLLVQKANGTFENRAATAGLDFLERTRSALWIDLDADGDQDLVAATRPGIIFAENDGKGTYTVKLKFDAIRDAFSLAATDYDGDQDLDIFVSVYFPGKTARKENEENFELAYPVPYYNANNGGINALLHNEGNWKFRDVTREVGLDSNNTRFSFASSWEDFDNDGDPDLYVANDFGRNNLYRNDGGQFVDVAEDTGASDQSFGMSVAWGDHNNDGWMDLYVSNMFSGAGGRITYQDQFQGEIPEVVKARYQFTARGNSLLTNRGGKVFRDDSASARVTMGRWSWGSTFADINNDSFEDLLVTNGYITAKGERDL